MNESLLISKVRLLLASGEAKQIRLRGRVEISEIARDVGVSEAAVRRWEHGERVPRGPVAVKYAQILESLKAVGEVEQP